MEITKEKFEDYRNCQQLGIYNMLAYSQYVNNGLTNLTKDEWFEIIKNYKEYFNKFK